MGFVPAGKMRQRLTLQAPVVPESFDTFSVPVASFNPIGTFWGYLRPVEGREAIIARQVKSTATHLLTTWWLGSIVVNPTCQWVFGSRTLGIVSVKNIDERNIQYEYLLEEVQQNTTVV